MDNTTINRALCGDADAAAECTAAGVAIPCPMCGKNVAPALTSHKRDKERWFVMHGEGESGCNCMLFMESDAFTDQRDANGCKQKLIAAWNRRVKWEE